MGLGSFFLSKRLHNALELIRHHLNDILAGTVPVRWHLLNLSVDVLNQGLKSRSHLLLELPFVVSAVRVHVLQSVYQSVVLALKHVELAPQLSIHRESNSVVRPRG